MASSPIPAQTDPTEQKQLDSSQQKPKQPVQVQETTSNHLKFLNRAVQTRPAAQSGLACTAREVESVKTVLKLLPIFLSTIMLSCCLAQLSTFSVQQAATMDTRIARHLSVPPASLPILPIASIMILAPLFEHVLIPCLCRLTKTETGITHLQRIGTGLLLSALSMAVAAAVEAKRKRVSGHVSGRAGPDGPLPMSFLWIGLQYLFLGSADLFTLAGLLEFFFSEGPVGMRSLATSLSWASLAMGYYLSSVLVGLVNVLSRRGGERRGWLEGSDLNEYRLERFYWLMCGLSFANFAQFLFWARRYKYGAKGSVRR